MNKMVKGLAGILLLLLAIYAVLRAVTEFFPSLFGVVEVKEEGRSADTDFPVVVRTKGGMLEVASVTGTRNFPKAFDPEILGQKFSYCREKASWTAPYKITYRVRLASKWPLRYHDGALIAHVPQLEPSLPVPIDFERLRKGAEESCWFVPDQGTRDAALRAIGPELRDLASSQKTKNFARESARRTIKEYLRTWVINQSDYPDIQPDAEIKVFFSGE
ncbi:hypothetical protein [Parafrankia sp. BMG5.11]|uniref:hypothetical protein n=1 Tax=Parafrankia sp. BMG5.11 TaxID=222540 RepID=UPI00103997DF|nr:hypothetical protein [Parafrankia sp. BMG5.11]TCJ41278.1 hypothetical protein E0504_01305 [Parafrankia sp. BMG5.11]